MEKPPKSWDGLFAANLKKSLSRAESYSLMNKSVKCYPEWTFHWPISRTVTFYNLNVSLYVWTDWFKTYKYMSSILSHSVSMFYKDVIKCDWFIICTPHTWILAERKALWSSLDAQWNMAHAGSGFSEGWGCADSSLEKHLVRPLPLPPPPPASVPFGHMPLAQVCFHRAQCPVETIKQHSSRFASTNTHGLGWCSISCTDII